MHVYCFLDGCEAVIVENLGDISGISFLLEPEATKWL